MAEVYRSVNGKPIQKAMAVEPEVQDSLEAHCFEITARAESLLAEHRAEGHAEIDVEHGNVDYYVILSDERGQKAAMSIEYGRAAGIDPETGKPHGGMDGLFILHRASNLPKKRRARVRLDD